MIISDDSPFPNSTRVGIGGVRANAIDWEATSSPVSSQGKCPRGIVDLSMPEDTRRARWLKHHGVLTRSGARVDDYDLLVSVGGRKDIRSELASLCLRDGIHRDK
jgi:hypothetical protein